MQDAGEVAKALGTHPVAGLAGPEAARRLREDGRNALHAAPTVAPWRRMASHFQDPLIYLLLVAITIALAAWLITVPASWALAPTASAATSAAIPMTVLFIPISSAPRVLRPS